MPIVQIAPATKKGMKFLISLYGMSETGKTLSALKLACGMQPDPAKRGLLDTEGGQRGRAYVDEIEGGYMYGELTAPFTPERYVLALEEFIKMGITVLVVDSASHAWFAEGGVLDMVEAAGSGEGNQLAKWEKPKRRLGKLTQRWQHCGIHIILCSRGKQPLIEGPISQRTKKPTLVPGPVVPIQEKSMRYDMTIMALMLGDGEFSIEKKDGGKCLGRLRPIFHAGQKMDEDMGRKMIAWLGADEKKSGDQRALEMQASEEAEKGTKSLNAWIALLSLPNAKHLATMMDNLRSIAKSADDEAARREAEASGEPQDDLDAPFDDREPASSKPASSKPALREPVTRADKNKVKTAAAEDELVIYPSDLEYGNEGLVLDRFDHPDKPDDSSVSYRSWLIELLVRAHTQDGLEAIRGHEAVVGLMQAKKVSEDCKQAVRDLIDIRAGEIGLRAGDRQAA